MFNSIPLKGQTLIADRIEPSLTYWMGLGYILKGFKGFKMFEHLCHLNPDCDRDIMQSIITLAAAAITRSADCTAVVLSESAVVRVFYKGEMVAEIVPDIWMLSREMTHLEGDIEERQYAGVRIFSLRPQEEKES